MPRRALRALALLLASTAACSVLDNDDGNAFLTLSGTVRSEARPGAPSRPVAGATVRVFHEPSLVGAEDRLLGEAITDTAGRFEARVRRPPGHDTANCGVMSTEVSATGYRTVSSGRIVGAGGPNDSTCDTGRGTLDVVLPPAP